MIEVQKTLQEDPATVSANLLRHISMQLANQTIDPAPFSPADFHSPPGLIAVNVLWFSSLLFSIFSALFGIFVKQWLHTYGNWSDIDNPMDAIRVRHRYRRGFAKWHVLDILAILPSLLQLALLFFVVGLVTYLWTVDRIVAGFSTVLACVGFAIAITAILLPHFYPICPYKSPLGWLMTCTLGDTHQMNWRSRDLEAVKEDYGMPAPNLALQAHKDIHALLEIVPEADEPALDEALITGRVNELETHPDPLLFKLLVHLVTPFASSSLDRISSNVLKSAMYVLNALALGQTFIIQALSVEALVNSLTAVDVFSMNGFDAVKGYINIARTVLKILLPHKDTQENPRVKAAAGQLLDCLSQWITTGQSHTIGAVRQLWLSGLQTEINSLHQDFHPTRTINVQSPVRTVVCSPDGANFAAGLYDGTVCIIDATTGSVTATLACHRDHINSVAFFPTSISIVTGSDDNTLKICSINTGQILNTFHGHTDSVQSVAVSPNGLHIVSGSFDNTVCIWSVCSNQDSVVLRGHSEEVCTVAFSPDGTCIASGSSDKTVKLWDATTHQCLQTLIGHTRPVSSVAISPNGQVLVSASWDVCVCLDS